MDLIRFVSEPRSCSYLAEETSQLEYRVPLDLNVDLYSELVRRGWRRFGMYAFRPQCPNCRKCRSIRIPVEQFRPTKSQRKAWNRNQHVELQVGPPTVTDEHVRLFNQYHEDMTDRRGWFRNKTSVGDYFESFIGGDFDFAREFQYRIDGELVGVGLSDVTLVGVSSVYFFHAPAWRSLSPGTFSIMKEIEFTRKAGLPHLYLGYWITENQSMDYKARFRPHELLDTYVEESENPLWCEVST